MSPTGLALLLFCAALFVAIVAVLYYQHRKNDRRWFWWITLGTFAVGVTIIYSILQGEL